LAFTKLRVQVTGRVITEPTLREVAAQGGTTQVCSFRVAVERPGAKKDEKGYYPSDVFQVSVWNRGNFKAAEYTARDVKKGERVQFEADALQAETFTRKDGGAGVSIKLRAIPDSIISFAPRRGVETEEMGRAEGSVNADLENEANRRSAPGDGFDDALDGLETSSSDDLDDIEFP
jgi:single-stranded DNA-binding protein